MQILFETG